MRVETGIVRTDHVGDPCGDGVDVSAATALHLAFFYVNLLVTKEVANRELPMLQCCNN
jgi:hypothetical protein